MSLFLRWHAAWNRATDRENFTWCPHARAPLHPWDPALQYLEKRKSAPLPSSQLRRSAETPPAPPAPFMIFEMDGLEDGLEDGLDGVGR